MNPMVADFVKSCLRWALTLTAAWFIHKGIVTDQQAAEWIPAAAAALVPLVWSLVTHVSTRMKILTALSADRKMTEGQLDHAIAGAHPAGLPAITTPKDEIPVPRVPALSAV